MAERADRRQPGQLGPGAAVRPVLGAAALTALVAVWFAADVGGTTVLRYADDLGTELTSLVSGFAALRAARREPPAYRRAWLLLAAGAFTWAIAEASWATVDLTTGKGVTNSVSDVGFLMLPILASAAILSFPTYVDPRRRWRWLLDGAIVAVSACLILWDALIKHTMEGELSGFKAVTNAAFPVVDLALVTAMILAAAYARDSQARLGTLAVGLALLTVGDTGFAYLAAEGSYRPGAFCDVAYIGAFATLAAAASMPRGAERKPRRRWVVPAPVRLALPYVPLAVASGVAIYNRVARGRPLEGATLVLAATLTTLVIARQYLDGLDRHAMVQMLQRQQAQLQVFALTDSLTGVGNRTLFADRVRHALALHSRDGEPVAVYWIDFDDFKLINDTLGHGAGDEVLTAVSQRMARVLRPGDTIARVGGDEFAVLIEGHEDPYAVAERLYCCSMEPVIVGDRPVYARLSIGMALLRRDEPGVSADELMSRADIAMYVTKASYTKHITVYQPGMAVPGAQDATLREPLKDAVASGAIGVHYQPIVTADTGKVVAFEALARWTYNGEAIPPDRFVPLAERLGLAWGLGRRVLTAALAQLGDWSRARGDHQLLMTVNLSPEQLTDVHLPDLVAQLIKSNELEPNQVVLEITERALLTDNVRALATARTLSDLGVMLSLDDFGTGYSSLAHLRGFPLAALKIDRSFIADIDVNPQARDFLQAVARLGHDLDLRLVTEGVERISQLEIVRSLGPVCVQGYLFCPPLPAAEVDNLAVRRDATLNPQAHVRHLRQQGRRALARSARPVRSVTPLDEARSVDSDERELG